jgi:hypothetical protein
MKLHRAAILGLIIFATTATSAIPPALALGGCGPNRHRNWAGRCVFGGQNQAYCVWRTGHAAVPGPYGSRICIK